MSDPFWPYGLPYARLPCPSLSPGICSNSCPLNWWCYLTISFSATPFSCLQSFPAPGSFPMRQLFALGGQRFGPSASASVLPMNIQGWFPLRLTGLISLLSKGLSGVFSSAAIWKHQFFDAQSSLWSNSVKIFVFGFSSGWKFWTINRDLAAPLTAISHEMMLPETTFSKLPLPICP